MQQCNDMVEFFYASMSHVISKVVPTTLVKFSSSDRSWITLYFKHWIKKRGVAFASGNIALYNSLHNRVRKSLQRQFYLNKLYKLKNEDPASWRKNIKYLVRFDSFKSNNDHLRYQSAEIPTDLLPDVINEYFVSVSSHIPPLDPIIQLSYLL